MLIKIAFKNFRSDLKNYILYFSSFIVSIMMIFIFLSIYNITMKGMDEQQFIVIFRTLSFAVPVTFAVTGYLMYFALKQYLRSRIRDYSILLTLGIRRKTLWILIFLEYVFCFVLSLIAGLLSGNAAIWLFRSVMNRYSPVPFHTIPGIRWVYAVTIGCSLFFLVIMVARSYIILSSRELSALMTADLRREKIYTGKIAKTITVLGAVLVGLSIFIRLKGLPLNLSKMILPAVGGESPQMLLLMTQIICLAGIYLILAYGGGLLLKALKKRETYYFRHILQWNSFYFRYHHNKGTLIAVFFIHYFIISAFLLSDNVSMVQEYADSSVENSNYPYDIVWLANAPLQNELTVLNQKYEASSESVPYFPVACDYVPEFYGISETEYNKRIPQEEHVQLNQDEVVLIKQASLMDSYAKLFPSNKIDIVPGKSNAEASFKNDGFEEAVSFRIKDQKSKILFLGYDMGNILVFSDVCFDAKRKEQNMESQMLLIHTDKSKEDEVIAFLDQRQEKMPEEKMYIKKTAYQSILNQAILKLCINFFVGIAMLLCSLFILYMKLFSELPDLQKKYLMLNCIGMAKEDKRRTIQKELAIFVTLPILLACFAGSVMKGLEVVMFYRYSETTISSGEMSLLIKESVIVLGVYFAIQILVFLYMRHRLVEELENIGTSAAVPL